MIIEELEKLGANSNLYYVDDYDVTQAKLVECPDYYPEQYRQIKLLVWGNNSAFITNFSEEQLENLFTDEISAYRWVNEKLNERKKINNLVIASLLKNKKN